MHGGARPLAGVTRKAPHTTELPTAADFSLVVGGPLYQVYRRTRLSDDGVGRLHRRIVAAVLLLWAPPMVLAAIQGGLAGAGREGQAIEDVGFQLRFLLVVPLLIIAEVIVHRRMRPIIEEFGKRRLVRPDQAARFAEANAEAARWRNAWLAEAALLAIVYAVGILFTLRRYVSLGAAAWYGSPTGGLSPAGYWLVFVSLPLLQFLLLRWYFRLAIWWIFLWRVSRLDLELYATHPDKAGGLGFLGDSLVAFVPIAVAHGALFAGALADRILIGHAKLTDFNVEIAAGAVVLLLVFVGPLMVFVPRLERVKRRDVREYGALGQDYVRGFSQKWMSGAAPDEALVGSGDIQSLADLGNCFSGAEQMRFAPIQPRALVVFVAAFLVPMLPLLLTIMSPAKLVSRLVGVVF